MSYVGALDGPARSHRGCSRGVKAVMSWAMEPIAARGRAGARESFTPRHYTGSRARRARSHSAKSNDMDTIILTIAP